VRTARPSVLVLNVIAVLLLASELAGANLLAFEGVTYSPSTGNYTYRYAIDNRHGTVRIGEIGIMVFARNGYVPFLPPMPHTSPPGWTETSAIGNAFGPCCGLFQLWHTDVGVDPGQYLSGFSLTTPNGPTTAVPGTNYFVWSPSSANFVEVGTVPAPGLPDVEIPILTPGVSFFLIVSLALFAVSVIGRS
jgi:hypothetical protein